MDRQEPSFKVEFVRDAQGVTQGGVRAQALNPSAREFIQQIQGGPNKLKSALYVCLAEEELAFGDNTDHYETLEGTWSVTADTLTFTPVRALAKPANLTAVLDGEGFTGPYFQEVVTESSTSAGESLSANTAAWFPKVTTVPANALKFYLTFSQPMTEGIAFEHLRLEAFSGGQWEKVEGAFRESELWSPSMRRLTVWLHPGRQKEGVNLNEDEGPVLLPDRQYRLVLDHRMTTQNGEALREDAVLEFKTTAPDHALPDPKQWAVKPAGSLRSSQEPELHFPEPMDWAMLHHAVTLDGEPIKVLVDPSGTKVTLERMAKYLEEGRHMIGVSPELEDLAGNNLIRPFEMDVTETGKRNDGMPGRIEFEVNR